MFNIVVGHSEEIDGYDAIQEVIMECNNKLDNKKPCAGVLFCALDFEYEVILNEISKSYPDIELIGCSSDGELSSGLGYLEDSIVLTLFVSDTVEIKAGIGKNLSLNIEDACKNAVLEAKSKMSYDSKFCLTTPESLTASAVEVLNSLTKELGTGCPVFGGTSADQWKRKKTYQFYKTEVLSDSIPVLIFGGNVEFSFGVSSGWQPIGMKKRVTKVDKNIVHEINDMSAVEFYNNYLGESSDMTYSHPLAVFPEDLESGKFYLRNPAQMIDETGSVVYFGDIPKNSYVQLTEGLTDKIINGASIAINDAFNSYSENLPQAAMVFSCTGRAAILGTKTKEEIRIAREVLGEECVISGMYGYGEYSPLVKHGENLFHNSTFVIVLMGEAQ